MSRSPLRAALLAVAALALAPAAASAASPTVWLCKPGQSPNPCTSSRTATLVPASGPSTVQRGAAPAGRTAKVDCFFVYPTVSGQDRTNATRAKDPELKAIAQAQASRFAPSCRMFAPVYRQLTLKAIATPRSARTGGQLAYGDVRDAWREYLRRHNGGRGVVLIGHSQGTFMLRELIAKEIDRRPAVRRRLVSALLIGGNVEVARGSDRGGDFRNVAACRRARQVGCVVAYSMFDRTPAPDSRFGRTPTTGRQVLCTNPGALGGGSARLDAYAPSAPFPGTLGVALRQSITLPQVPTPWVAFPGRSTARCRSEGGATWLDVQPVAGDTRPTFVPQLGPTWGLHTGDVNIAFGQLTALVRRQIAAYVARARA